MLNLVHLLYLYICTEMLSTTKTKFIDNVMIHKLPNHVSFGLPFVQFLELTIVNV